MNLSLDDIRQASATISGGILRTPTVVSRLLSEICQAKIHLKLENLQYTASFKERGALNKLTSLTEKERNTGVIAMSAGNHAQGLAYHAQRLSIPATIVMPKSTPFVKVSHTEHLGATVILHGESLHEAAQKANEVARKKGLLFIHPYDDEKIIAGQGTIALEVLEEIPDVDTLIVPIGGGGLISGIAVAAKALKPSIEIIGIEVDGFASMRRAVTATGNVDGNQTIAEGIAVKKPGGITKGIVEALVDEILVVGEAEIENAVQQLLEIEKTVAEGAGAASLAGILSNQERFKGKTVCLIITGGNIDSRMLASILMRGLVRDGRLTRIRISLSDAPGNLAKVSSIIGGLDANIIEISHQRLFQNLPVKMAELDVVLETRDRFHLETVLKRLVDEGFAANLVPGFT